MMLKALLLSAVLFLSISCTQVEPNTDDQAGPIPTPSVAVDVNAMRPIDVPKLGRVNPIPKLSARQRKYLDESIPSGARHVLENAERFELLGEIDKDESSEADNRSLVPNRLVTISTEKDKLAVLEAFYSDASSEDSPAVCYEPHHAIRAELEGETVEVEICFSCSRFILKHGSDKYSGTIVREGRRSEELFDAFFSRASQ
jgi:hypothetical protein